MQGRREMIEKWLQEDKLECSEELGTQLQGRRSELKKKVENEQFSRFRKFQRMFAKFHSLAANTANLHIVFQFPKTSAKFRQNLRNKISSTLSMKMFFLKRQTFQKMNLLKNSFLN